MNPKLFGAIVVVGAALGANACRTELLEPRADLGRPDMASPVDQAAPFDHAVPVDLASSDLQRCCEFPGVDLSGCIPITCILI